MVVLESCPKHNMVAYLEKTAGNAEFHAVIDFLMRSSIHNALTVKPSAFTHIPDSIPESSGRNHGGHSSSDKSLSGNEGDMTLQSVYDLCNSFSPDDMLDYIDLKYAQDEGLISTEETSATPTTPTTTHTMFRDDETIAQVLLNMSQAKAVSREKEKGVELKDVEDSERPRPTSTRSLLTLKPLPKIDPKDKGKNKIEEKMSLILLRIEEIARKVEDREQFIMEERAKFLHDTIAAQRRFLAEQRAIAIKNKPPTRT
ncbi:hypothetical protein Tco_1578095 [Tanacetum coccineum]